ncbi:MAG: UvrD-helicase domain-containing protein [Oscillospiraceae bacterium]|jgi:ATP-dependent helicase/nuclease subunit A|nr:UvrD-helicase domain-containing protein [Oscillospiraceae bacterium]
MPHFSWTSEQQEAIDARGSSLLISAAAGSGKTAVLVERVLRMLCDAEHPCGADELLIVTFTRAAAAQMRERIDQALDRRLREQPNHLALLRQKQLLPLADICTIDSFCMRLVQEHAPMLGLPPGLRMLDPSETLLLRAQAAEEALEAAYETDSPSFQLLGLLLEIGGDDRQLIQLMQRAADLAMASPAPTAWLRALAAPYEKTDCPPQDTDWGQLQLAEADARLAFCRELIEGALRDLEADPALSAKYAPAFLADLELANAAGALVRAGKWDELYGYSPAFARLGAKPKGSDDALAESAKARRKKAKELLSGIAPLFCVSMAEHTEDMKAIAPIAKAFAGLAQDYLDRFSSLKLQRQTAEFNDNLHWALQLLVDAQGNQTDLAKQLCAKYREILVDEYQDINAAQERLFQALSRNGENLFLVGDVKQSIYRFRQAEPRLFLEKRHAWHSGGALGRTVILGKNFRSRPGVTDAVNFVFRQLMRADAMEIGYTEEEELVCREDFAPAERPDTEFHLLGYADGSAAEAEARYLADWIANEIARDGRRPGDFCILLRSDKSNGALYAQALRERRIEAYAAENESLFRSREIQLLLSLLRVIDNPAQDIPLAAILLSPFVGFTPDGIAQLRKKYPHAPTLYHCLREDANAFLEQLAAWRRMAASLAPGDLLRHLLEDTALPELAGALPQPARRRANLRRLEEYAASFSTRPGASLSGFLRYMDKVEADQSLLSVNVASETADVVRIMSIHKSKGLEFPVCILARCGGQFNLKDLTPALLLHSERGLGLQRPQAESRSRLPTLPHMALKTALRRAALSEELRLLYVAMTRAKERLVLLAGLREPEAKLRFLAGQTPAGQRFPASFLTGAGSFAEWLCAAFLRHPDAHILRKAAGLEPGETLPAKERAAFVLAQSPSIETQAPLATRPALCKTVDPALQAAVDERLRWQYPYAALTRLAAKRGASELTEQAQQEAFAFSSRPAFARRDSISASQRGTAMHAFLQFADFRRAAENLELEVEYLRQQGYLTARDAKALERDKLARFFASEFCARMLRSQKPLLREKKFTLRLPAAELADLAPELLEHETIVIQGVIDCAFEEDGKLILLDYKTDNTESLGILKEKYGDQLRLYRRAMRECFGMPVSETLLYSFWLGDWAEIA